MFQLKITTELGDKKIIITDETGNYHETTNPTGWGSPNVERASVERAEIRCYFNNELEKVLEITDEVVAGDTEFEYTPEKWVDGVYKFYFVVSTDADTYTSEPALQFIYEKVKESASIMWARLAAEYDRFKYNDLFKEVQFIELHISGMDSFNKRGMEKNFLSLLRIVEERIIINI